MWRFLPLLVLLNGCAGLLVGLQSATGHTPCDSPADDKFKPPVSEQALRASWEKWFKKPLPESCSAHWVWTIESVEELKRSCGQSMGADGTLKDAAGCTVYTIGPNGTREPGCPYTITTPDLAGDVLLAHHEIAHWFLHCSSKTFFSDPNHTNQDVWGPQGWVHSSQ